MTHELKCWPESFNAIIEGRKFLELRLNDRDFEVGDNLLLKEFIPCPRCNGSGRMPDYGGDKTGCDTCNDDHGIYTSISAQCQVTHVLHGGQFGLARGHVAMSIKVNAIYTGFAEKS